MKFVIFTLVLNVALLPFARNTRADLTVLEKVEGLGPASEMTIKIKGDKVRIEVSPKVTTIFDGKTGEMTNLMNDEKTVVRISADKMKAAAEMIKKFSPKKEAAEKPKLVATGRKESLNGYETEQYVYEGPDFKATYWIALKYPDGANILKQLQAIKSEAWNAGSTKLPDYRDFPGLPLRTHMVVKKGATAGEQGAADDRGTEITSTITSVKQDPLSDSEFGIPKDFKEMEMPDILGGKTAAPSVSPGR
jgi:hypothetical protein